MMFEMTPEAKNIIIYNNLNNNMMKYNNGIIYNNNNMCLVGVYVYVVC